MDYHKFCSQFPDELPFNRKERFFTGTVLPSLLFHHNLEYFYKFLHEIPNFPKEQVNQKTTGTDFFFYTEYNYKQAGDVSSDAETNDTPDIVIEIIKPIRVIVIVEAKMFATDSQTKLNEQIRRQKEYVGDKLKNKLECNHKKNVEVLYIALLPEEHLKNIKSENYMILRWELFLNWDFTNNIFFNYLKYALKHYHKLKQKRGNVGLARTVKFVLTGKEMYAAGLKNDTLWVGRRNGEDAIISEIESGQWANNPLNGNFSKPERGRTKNWIPITRFIELVDSHKLDK